MIIFNYLGGSLQVEEGGRSVSVRGTQYEKDATRPFLAKEKRNHEARNTGKGKQIDFLLETCLANYCFSSSET